MSSAQQRVPAAGRPDSRQDGVSDGRQNVNRQRDLRSSLHPYTNLQVHEEQGPFVITRGDGVFVEDDRGRRFLEGMSGLWCAGLGFSEPRLVEAASQQMARLPFNHGFSHRASEPVIDLADRLVDLAPASLDRAIFVNSGSEAVDLAIKIAWYVMNARGFFEKKKVISRVRAYHGVTIAAGSLTALPYAQKGFDLPVDRFLHTETPHPYRFQQAGESEEDYATRLAEYLEDLIVQEEPETVAAFIAEPVMGAGGVIMPPATYFEKVQAVCKKYEVLFIADEVICGFGRTGNFWGSDTYGIQPDMMTCAKQLSSGYLPIAGLMMSDAIYQDLKSQAPKYGVFGHGNTYGGHPVSAAVACEVLDIYEERDIIGGVRERATLFSERVERLNAFELVGEARSVGLLGGVELIREKPFKVGFAPETMAAAKVVSLCLEQGLILRALPGDCIGICPPLIISEGELNQLFDILEGALEKALQTLKDQ
ncbi:MAG: aminotransferase [Magnetovibrionaceae bacterium]